jgi:protein-disulfide isomerase
MKPKYFLSVLVLVLVVGVALIVGATRPPPAISSNLRQVRYSFQGREQLAVLKPISVDALEGARFIFGQASAPVTVVEFADYQCPACGVFANQFEPELETKLVQTGRIRYAFRDFPLSIHANAPVAARAATCVHLQSPNQFRAFHKKLFEAQSDWSGLEPKLAAEKILGYAQVLGLDAKKIATCLVSSQADVGIQKDMDAGIKVQLSGTPSFVFVSKKGSFLMAGAMPVEGFEAVLAELD